MCLIGETRLKIVPVVTLKLLFLLIVISANTGFKIDCHNYLLAIDSSKYTRQEKIYMLN